MNITVTSIDNNQTPTGKQEPIPEQSVTAKKKKEKRKSYNSDERKTESNEVITVSSSVKQGFHLRVAYPKIG